MIPLPRPDRSVMCFVHSNGLSLSLLLLAGVVASSSAQADDARGPVVNGGFESPTLPPWTWVTSGDAWAHGELDSQEKAEGTKSYKITNASPKQPNVYAAVCQHVKGLQPSTLYRITCRLKGKDVSDGRFVCGPGWNIRKVLPLGTYDWTPFSCDFVTDASGEPYQILFIASDVVGALWIDDVKIELVASDEGKPHAKSEVSRPSLWRDSLPMAAAFYPAYSVANSAETRGAPAVRVGGEPAADSFGADVRLARDSREFFFGLM